MHKSDFTYNTLKANRDKLIVDCDYIADNIDKYKGELVYINYDIGTGKSTTVAKNIVAKIYENKRILIIVYSYIIAEEWKQKIKEQDPRAQIFVLSNPNNKYSSCRNKKDKYKKKSLEYINTKFCTNSKRGCNLINDDCPGSYHSKIKSSNILITSSSLFLENQELFTNFDVIIFDEVSTLDLTADDPLNDFKELFDVQKLIQCNEFSDENYVKLAKLCKKYIYYSETWTYDSLFKGKTEENKLPLEPIKITDDLKISVEYLYQLKNTFKAEIIKIEGKDNKAIIRRAIKTIDALIKVFENSKCTYIYPRISYDLVKIEEEFRSYYVTQLNYTSIELVSKIKFDIKGLISPSDNSKQAVVLILSALNTKSYIEYIFATKIKSQNCYGHMILNKYPNVISTNYLHASHDSNSDAKEFKSYTKKSMSYYRKEYDRSNLLECIEAFINSYKEEKVIIAGSKILYDLIKKQCDDYMKKSPLSNFEDNKENNLIYELRILPYEYFIEADEETQSFSIPYIHFGMSGINDFAGYRALLVINEYITPIDRRLLYIDKSYEFHISENDYHYNLEIIPMRQTEGRIFRFTNKTKLKYVYRLNYYDYNSQYLPDLSNPYIVCKQFKSFKESFSGMPKTYMEYNNDNSKSTLYIQTTLWDSLFRNDIEIMLKYGLNKYNSKKDLFNFISITEYILQLSEQGYSVDRINSLLFKHLCTLMDLKPRSFKTRVQQQLNLLEKINLNHLCFDDIDDNFIPRITEYIRNRIKVLNE